MISVRKNGNLRKGNTSEAKARNETLRAAQRLGAFEKNGAVSIPAARWWKPICVV